MSSRDLAETLTRLERVAQVAATLLAHARDLHDYAYEKASRGLEPVAAGGPPSGVETVGNPEARELWRELVREAAAADEGLGDVKVAALNLLSAGPPMPGPSRGSTLRPEELEALVARAAARGGPARLVEQPAHPLSAMPKPKPKRRRKK